MDAKKAQLTHFLQEELELSEDAVQLVLGQCKSLKRLPVILWQQKLVSFGQLDRLLAWLEGHMTRVA